MEMLVLALGLTYWLARVTAAGVNARLTTRVRTRPREADKPPQPIGSWALV